MRIFKLYLFSIVYAGILFTACDNKKYTSSIPTAPVSIRLNVTAYASNLLAANEYIYFTERDEVKGVYSVGYGGIIVYSYMTSNTMSGVAHTAFDMSCTYEKEPDIRVYPDDTRMSAVCEKCGSKFNLIYGQGYVEEGPANERLRQYNATINAANYLIVTQKYQ